MALVGPGSVETVTEEVGSTLDGASEYEYVTVLNPLTDDFAVRVGQTRPVNLPFEIRKDGNTSTASQNEGDVQRNYGITLKNPDNPGKAHITNTVIVESGKTKNFVGSEAQVAVRQIVNELMQREGNTKLLSDPVLRREAESRVIIKRGTVEELMGGGFVSPQKQAVDALNRSNEVQTNGQNFPGLRTAGDNGTDSSQAGDATASESVSESGAIKSSRAKKPE